MANVADSISTHAQQRPWAVAILENDSVIHYRTFGRLIWLAARYLHQAGIRPGDVVGVALPHSSLYLIAIYALARMGAVSTALPLNDPSQLRENFARWFGIKSVVATIANAGPAGNPTVVLTHELLTGDAAEVPAFIRVDGGDRPWNIRRTSETTSEAKGIAVTHSSFLGRIPATSACLMQTGCSSSRAGPTT